MGRDMGAFLCFMAVRLLEMSRVLRDDGSIYLHCDPTASHYLKELMDAIFGRRNFRNEIVWCYTGPSSAKRWFPRKHDTILAYAKSASSPFFGERVTVPYKMIGIGKGDTIFRDGDDPRASRRTIEARQSTQ